MSKKIDFMGTPDYATVIFQKLLESHYEVLALFTQPDKKVGRKQILTYPHIKQFCVDNGLSLPIYQPTTLKDEKIINSIKSLNPDFIIVAAYGQILPKEILNIAPCINLHASLLPKYRGASPIQSAILNNDKYSGVTAMMMEETLDSGDILGFDYVKLNINTDVLKLFNQLSNSAASLIIDILERFDNITPKKQNEAKVSFCPKITKSDGLVSFDNSMSLYSKYKAYKYWPGIFLESGLKLKKISLDNSDSTNNEGEILQIAKDHIIVGCKIGTIKIFEVQPPSKKVMSVVDYIRGARLEVGNSLS
jgi:methionyl-tRNA formyltransferase